MAAQARELLRLLRLPSNRCCADCDAPLNDSTNVWASTTYGVFVCVNCVSVHRKVGTHISRVRSVNLDVWMEEDIICMRQPSSSGGNAYGGSGRKEEREGGREGGREAGKGTVGSRQIRAQGLRRASLRSRRKALGQGQEKNGGGGKRFALGGQTPFGKTAAQSKLPMRLVDFLVVVGMDEEEEIRLSCKVLDAYPPESYYTQDEGKAASRVPEHVAQFVYPDGFSLQSEEAAPTFFSFALTDVDGVRTHGCVLHLCEDVSTHPDPEKTKAAVTRGFGEAGLAIPTWVATGAFCVPKALVILSHFPFFDTYREVLLELYRISISSAPLPIERYIANFFCEVPLPPQGQIEVRFALPDRTLTISRPPKNRLPMAAFSFRPLFTCLSVDNILTVFGCLLTETRICLCSQHHALLTPIAEAFQSLLFPLVWQGAYIPIMPLGMADILDAPVPFFVGLNRRYLDHTPATHRPVGVVFVDLDRDVVHLGWDEERNEPQQKPHLPDREATKLRKALMECGAMAHNPRGVEVWTSDLAFPNNEHHLPISSFAVASSSPYPAMAGMVTSGMKSPEEGGPNGGEGRKETSGNHRRRDSKEGWTGRAQIPEGEVGGAAAGSSGDRGGGGKKGGSNTASAISNDGSRPSISHPAASVTTQLSSFHPSHIQHLAGATLNMSLLDVQNNEGMPDGFSATQVRAAFLRFFVSLLRNYAVYLNTAPVQTLTVASSASSSSSNSASKSPPPLLTCPSPSSSSSSSSSSSILSPKSSASRLFSPRSATSAPVEGGGAGGREGGRGGGGGGGGGGTHKKEEVSAREEKKDQKGTPTTSPTSSVVQLPPLQPESFNKDGFLKECLSHASSDPRLLETMNTVLSSQMFERFIEERQTEPDHPQIKFFDESIIAKLNRSKTQLKKGDTTFLDDMRDTITETFNPPPPSNWGLPDTGLVYTYPAFPKLKPELFGNIRKPRRLFKLPEQQRTAGSNRSVNAQVFHRSLSHLVPPLSPSSSPSSPSSTSTSSQQPNFNALLSLIQLPALSKLGVLGERAQGKVPQTIRGLVLAQALSRGHVARQLFRKQQRAATVIATHWRSFKRTQTLRASYLRTVRAVLTLQRGLRRHLTRRLLERRRAALQQIQPWVRMAVARRRYRRTIRGIAGGQALWRGYSTRCSYMIIRNLVVGVQAVARGWLQRLHAKAHREQRLSELRRHLFVLWRLANTPLLHRANFWKVFGGTGFLHLALHEDEVLRVWADLGLGKRERGKEEGKEDMDLSAPLAAKGDSPAPPALPSSLLQRQRRKEMSFVRRFGEVDALLQAEEEATPTASSKRPPSFPTSSSTPSSLPSSSSSHRTSIRLSLRPLSLRPSTFSSSFSPSPLPSLLRSLPPSLLRQHMIAAERLQEERRRVYLSLKTIQQEGGGREGGGEEDFFGMFGLRKGKRRKRQLAQMLWMEHAQAAASAEVVLATLSGNSSNNEGGRTMDWLQVKLDERIRRDLLLTGREGKGRASNGGGEGGREGGREGGKERGREGELPSMPVGCTFSLS
ncbi:Hypothetical protein NocV09_06800120 [Nannochloropsis oceanica]